MEKEKNKSKNANSFEIPQIVLFWAKFLQFISKDLVTIFASKIFATPLKFKVPERELMMRNSAKKEKLFLEKFDTEIQVYEYGYSKKKVLLVHGWAGRGTQLFQLADKILENKMMVISFDAPAHGLSNGKRTNMLEFIEAIYRVNEKYGPFDAVVGHSFGGMSLINAVADGLKTNKLITIGADNSIPLVFKYSIKKLGLKPIIAEKLEQLFEKKYELILDSLTSQHKAEKINIPTFVVHDSEDKHVDVRSAYDIRQNLRRGVILVTNGLGHHRIFKDPYVIQRIINFIQ